MGIHGLSTYLVQHKAQLSRSLSLSSPAQSVPVVVDAWSFIYQLVHDADLPWVYGGEYALFASLLEHVVRAWLSVGLELHLVFDGPYPSLKFPTVVSRLTQTKVQSALLFFRTSPAARASPRFLRESAMLPPLAYSVSVHTLSRLARESASLHLHFADEEGDPYAVALAGRLGAYLVGRDSDFVVLNADGYRGYIPLDDMAWTMTPVAATATAEASALWDGESVGSAYSTSGADTESAAGDVDDDGFRTVRNAKSRVRKKASADPLLLPGRGILPPSALDSLSADRPPHSTLPEGTLTLSCAVYTPSALAAHLALPVSLLPLLGALLGNDFTSAAAAADNARPPPATTAEIRSRGNKANLQRLFFDRQLSLTQRITRAAHTLSGILASAFGAAGGGAGSAARAKKKQQIGSVMDLIHAAVTALLVRPLDTFATGELDAIVERIAEATLQYALPAGPPPADAADERPTTLVWASNVCVLHSTPDACPLFRNLSILIDAARASSAADNQDGASTVASGTDDDDDDDAPQQVRERYVAAYRRGELIPRILDTVHTGTMWPWLFLEDPDKESVVRSVARPIRLWMYAILDAGVGLPSAPAPEDEHLRATQDHSDGSDSDELVDVVEDDSEDDSSDRAPDDALARLRGALKELDAADDDGDDHIGTQSAVGPVLPLTTPSARTRIRRARPKAVVAEYIRRGTRLAAEDVSVSPLAEMLSGVSSDDDDDDDDEHQTLPPQLWPDTARRRLFLRALASDLPAVRALADAALLGVLAVRWAVRCMHLRSTAHPTAKERFLERWTHAEARAILASLTDAACPPDIASASASAPAPSAPAVAERHVQLVAQVLAILSAMEQLAQTLLLSSTLPNPACRWSGARCHALLAGRIALCEGQPAEEAWAACLAGLEEAYASPAQKKRSKEKKNAARAAAAQQQQPQSSARGKASGVRGGMFGLLADAQL